MKISVFTPFHKPENRYMLDRLFDSLCGQKRKPDEWVILLNGPAKINDAPGFKSPFEIKFLNSNNVGNIGALKGECCEHCIGDILVEVDYDDYLSTDALELVEKAFDSPKTKFVYSDAFEIDEKTGESVLYGAQYGWEYGELHGRKYNVSFPALPQYLRRIEWSPNHIRAFRKDAYNEIGGYSKKPVADDHDLVCRFYIKYGEEGFGKINRPIYNYKFHPGNTSNAQNRNRQIQEQTDANYCEFAEKMWIRWANDNGLKCIDLGGRFNCPAGYISVDRMDADMNCDLNLGLPFEDNSLGVIRAYHTLEHLKSSINFMNEAYRCLAPGGLLAIEVPSTSGPGAWMDPTHISFFNDFSFRYYTDEFYAKFIRPEYTGRFQESRVVEYYWPNGIPVVSAQLIALKGWYDANYCGLKQI